MRQHPMDVDLSMIVKITVNESTVTWHFHQRRCTWCRSLPEQTVLEIGYGLYCARCVGRVVDPRSVTWPLLLDAFRKATVLFTERETWLKRELRSLDKLEAAL